MVVRSQTATDVHSSGLELQSAASEPWCSTLEMSWSAEEGVRGEDNGPKSYNENIIQKSLKRHFQISISGYVDSSFVLQSERFLKVTKR